MSLIENWNPLIDGASEINADDINLIADAVIQNEKEIEQKINKVEGMGLSSQDYTFEEKTKLLMLPDGKTLLNKFKTIEQSVSNAVNGSITGKKLIIEDVSPIEHGINLKVHGKNVFNLNGDYILQTPYGNYEKTETGFAITPTSVTAAQSLRIWIPMNCFEVGKTYTFSSSLVSNNLGVRLTDTASAQDNGISLGADINTNKLTFTITEEKAYLRIYVYNGSAPVGEPYFLNNFQIEEGEEITDYEAYISPSDMTVTVNEKEYTPNQDGTVDNVNSVYPSMEITSDTQGAIISCEYNRDLNKVIEELTNAIISLGGNV